MRRYMLATFAAFYCVTLINSSGIRRVGPN